MNRYSRFFACYAASVRAGNPLSKDEIVYNFTQQRTRHLSDLSLKELDALCASLNQASGASYKPKDDKADKMRKSIIAIFKSMGKDVSAAKSWAEKQGVNGDKKPFNQYSTQELFVLIKVAEKVRYDFQLAIRKSISRA